VENGTTKHCGCCGKWNKDLTLAHREFICPACNIRVGRDINGARNNMLAPATALLGYAPDFSGMTVNLPAGVDPNDDEMLVI
jgi:transposase